MLVMILANTLNIPLLVHAAENEKAAESTSDSNDTSTGSGTSIAAETTTSGIQSDNGEIQTDKDRDSLPAENVPEEKVTVPEINALRATETVTPPYLFASSQAPANNTKNGLKGLKGTFQTDLFTGGGSFSYPLDVIPGRGGMTPSVVLGYSTQNTRQDSLVGYGWDINSSFIVRSGNKGTDKLYSENSFTASLFGLTEELVLTNAATGEFRPKVEGSFRVYTFTNGTWTARDKTGTQYIFGSTANSQQGNPADPTKIYKWMLEKVMDTNGNYMSFSYTKDQNQIYPDAIRYTGNGTDPGIFEVRFTLENRPVVVQNAIPGFMITTTKRMKQVDMRLNTTSSYQTAYSFIFNYNDGGIIKNLLTSVVQSSGSQNIPPLAFGYTSGTESPIQLPNLLKSIQTPYGGQTSIVYQSSKQAFNGNTPLNPKLFLQINTVKSITQKNSPSDSPKVTNYTYKNGHYFFEMLDSYKREYAGFGQVTVTDPLGQIQQLYFHQSEKDSTNPSTGPLGEFQDHLSKKGRIYRQETLDGSGNMYRIILSKWDRSDLGNGRSFPFLSQAVTMQYDGGSTHNDTAVSYAYDQYGNITSEKNWGEVTANNDGTFSDIGSDTVIKENLYAQSSTGYITALPQQVTLKDGSGTQLQQQRIFYDNLPLGQVAKGNMTKQEEWLNPGNRFIAAKQQTFNIFGLVTATTDPRGKTSTLAYDTYNLYAAITTNPLGHTTTGSYDYASGQAKETIDPNGVKTTNQYDPFGRLVETKITDPANTAAQKTSKTIRYFDLEQPVRVVETDFNGQTGNTGKQEIRFFDGVGQLMQTRRTAEGNNTYIVKSIIYDQKNRVSKELLPVFGTGASFTAPDNNGAGNMMSYDVLDRTKAVTNTLGSTTTLYDKWTKTVTDANGHSRKFVYDAYQNLIRVEDTNGSQTYSTRYDYDALKHLRKITDAESNIRTFSYDSLSRLLNQDMLHPSTAVNVGSWNYTYDDGGNLTARTDPENRVVNYSYDDLNRLLTEDFAGNGEIEVKNDYDDRPNAKGKLIRVTLPGYVIGLLYDPLGRVTSRYDVLDGVNYSTNTSYDLLGNTLSITYPNSKTVTYEYNNAYQINAIALAPGSTLVSNIDYSPLDMISRIDMGNGATTINTYDIAKLYRLTNKKTTKEATILQDLSYTYDPVGNLLAIAENAPTAAKRNATYTYDDLDRLLSATITNTNNNTNVSQTFSYSPGGNILSNSLLGNYVYDGANNANPQAVTRVGNDRTYAYDKNGNVVAIGKAGVNQNLSYDYRNNLSQSVKGTAVTKYAYDQGFNRIKKWSSGSNALQVYLGDYEIEGTANSSGVLTGTTLQRINVPLGKGQGVSIETTITGNITAPIYHHTDHLTGSSVDTDQNGYMLEVQDYLPFGSQRVDQRFQSYANKKKFTGKELDSENGLYYYGARYYDSDIGRFMGVDPAVFFHDKFADLLVNPQLLNNYSYVANNPLKYVDPDGQFLQLLAALVSVVVTAIDVLTTFFSGIPIANAPGPEGPVTAATAAPARDGLNGEIVDMAVGAVVGGVIGKGLGAGIEYVGGKLLGKAGEEAIQSTTSTVRQGIDDAINADIPKVSGDVLPTNVQNTVSQLKSNGYESLQGYKGKEVFENREGLLPLQKPNYYTEFDVKPLTTGSDRGLDRIVVGGQGETTFFTNTHYGTVPNGIDPPFYQIK